MTTTPEPEIADIFADDETTDIRLTDAQWAHAVRQLGGVHRALIAKANPWLLEYDSELRDTWVEMARLRELLDTLAAETEGILDLLAPRDTAGITPTSQHPAH